VCGFIIDIVFMKDDSARVGINKLPDVIGFGAPVWDVKVQVAVNAECSP
jgi:hypothetical protein